MAAADYYTQVYTMFVGYFGRPPAQSGLDYYANQVNAAGGKLDVVIDDFYKSAESQSFFAGKTIEQQVNQIFQNLFGRDAAPSGLNYWTNQITTGKVALAQAAYTIAYNAQAADSAILKSKVDSAKLWVAGLDTTTEILTFGTDAGRTAGRDFLKAITTSTPATQAAVDAALLGMVNGGNTNPGQTYTLTKDIQVLVGSNGDDTFVATNDAAANSPTLNTGDQVDGSAGTDTLKITSVSADTPVVTLKSIEKVQFQQLTANSGNVSAANWTGVTEIANVNSTKNLAVVDVGANAKISVTNGVAGNSTSVTFTNSKLGATAAVALAVNATGTKAGVHTIAAVTGGTDVVTTLSVDATGANFVKYDGSADDKITALNVTGTGTLSLSTNDNELRKLATVDASKNSGGLTIDLSGVTSTAMAVTGGSGKDSITANSSAIETVDLGLGDDTLTMGAAANVTAADSYKGGDGTDTLKFTAASNANTLATAKANALFTGFEVLGLTTVDADIDVSKWGVNSLTVSGDVTGAARTASGFTSGATVTLSFNGDPAQILNVGIKDATNAGTPNDTLNIKLAADLTADHAYKVGVDGINVLNVDATDPDPLTSTGAYTLTLSSASNVRDINVTGKSALVLNASAFGGTEGVKLASTASGNLTFTGTALGDVVTGGSGANAITGGNGKDTIDISASSAKQDSIVLTGIKAAANADTIKGFVAGASATTGDTVTVDKGDTTDGTGAGAADFQNATSAATVVNANQAVTQFNTTASKDVIELGNAALGSNGDLSAATTGTELLKALASSGTATGITAETGAGGDTVYFVAYQGGNAYLYYGNDAGGTNGLFEASEITLVGTFTGVAAGAFAQGDIVLV